MYEESSLDHRAPSCHGDEDHGVPTPSPINFCDFPTLLPPPPPLRRAPSPANIGSCGYGRSASSTPRVQNYSPRFGNACDERVAASTPVCHMVVYCGCGNFFRDDAVTCRRCGKPRAEVGRQLSPDPSTLVQACEELSKPPPCFDDFEWPCARRCEHVEIEKSEHCFAAHMGRHTTFIDSPRERKEGDEEQEQEKVWKGEKEEEKYDKVERKEDEEEEVADRDEDHAKTHSIGQRMVKDAVNFQRKRAALQLRKADAEQSFSFRPKMNAKSAEIASNMESMEMRRKRDQHAREEWLEKQRAEQEKSELLEVRGPHISHRARDLDRDVKALMRWEAGRVQRQLGIRQRQHEAKQRECTFTPRLCPGSKKLNMVSASDNLVHDRLHKDADRRQFAHAERLTTRSKGCCEGGATILSNKIHGCESRLVSRSVRKLPNNTLVEGAHIGRLPAPPLFEEELIWTSQESPRFGLLPSPPKTPAEAKGSAEKSASGKKSTQRGCEEGSLEWLCTLTPEVAARATSAAALGRQDPDTGKGRKSMNRSGRSKTPALRTKSEPSNSVGSVSVNRCSSENSVAYKGHCRSITRKSSKRRNAAGDANVVRYSASFDDVLASLQAHAR